jgi:hypothetical protein
MYIMWDGREGGGVTLATFRQCFLALYVLQVSLNMIINLQHVNVLPCKDTSNLKFFLQ